MQITDIKVRKLFDEGPMKAIVSVTFDGQLAVHDVKVINARDKFFIVMPSRKNPDDTYRLRAKLSQLTKPSLKQLLPQAQKCKKLLSEYQGCCVATALYFWPNHIYRYDIAYLKPSARCQDPVRAYFKYSEMRPSIT